MKKILPIALIAGALMFVTSKVQAARVALKSLRFRISNLGIDGGRTQQAMYMKIFVKVEVKLQNDAQAGATLQTLALALYQNGQKMADFVSNQPIAIAPAGQTTAKLTMIIPTLSIFTDVLTAIQAIVNNNSLSFNVQGFADFGVVGRININETVNAI